jgi:hypothetical protein
MRQFKEMVSIIALVVGLIAMILALTSCSSQQTYHNKQLDLATKSYYIGCVDAAKGELDTILCKERTQSFKRMLIK